MYENLRLDNKAREKRLKQSIAESMEARKEELKQSIAKSSNVLEQKLWERIKVSQQQLVSLKQHIDTSEAETKEQLVSLTYNVEVHINEPREGKTKLCSDLYYLTKRPNTFSVLVSEEIKKNSQTLCTKMKEQSDELQKKKKKNK